MLSRFRLSARVCFGLGFFTVLATLVPSARVCGQGAIFNTRQRAFVTGIIPVVGRNGAIGGVKVDGKGVVERATVEELGELRRAWEEALTELPGDLAESSKLRKVSLRRLEIAMAEHLRNDKPIPEEMHFLAGLQRVTHVFVYPEQKDIVLAGPAEGWRVDDAGNMVGLSTGRPTLQLADLVVALRTAEKAIRTGISCSIDPTEEGLARLDRILPKLQPGPSAVTTMEQTLGPQVITLEGIKPDNHFARVLVASDVVMKRLAMHFEPAPVRDMPSYLQLIKASRGRAPRALMPRWWLAPNYDALLKSEDGLAWQLRGQGVQAMTEDEHLTKDGVVATGKENALAQKWADTLTEKYDALSAKLPVFAELRNCMDLAVVAALVVKEGMLDKTVYNMPLLSNPKTIAVADFHIPKTIPSQGSFFQKGRDFLVSVSGGVQVDAWAVLEKVKQDPALADLRTKSRSDAKNWWWD